jgi:hypothetical protein
MKKIAGSFIVAFAIVCSSAAAQQVYTPEKGSAERTAILDALRIPVERQMKQKIVFVVETMNVSGTWAYVGGRPQTPSGGRPSLKGTVFEGEEDMFDDNFFGLLRKRRGKWQVVTHALGCTDVCYADWWRRYRAPKIIFPYTE